MEYAKHITIFFVIYLMIVHVYIVINIILDASP